MNLRRLLVEDDKPPGSSTKVGLDQSGFHVDWVTDADAADRVITAHRYDAESPLDGMAHEALGLTCAHAAV
jgi:DNA-binding response OmpR family regulator